MDGKDTFKSNCEFLKKFSSLDIESFAKEKEKLTFHERKEIIKFLIETLPDSDLEALGASLEQQDIEALLSQKDFFSSSFYLKASSLFIRLPLDTYEKLLKTENEAFLLWLKKEAEKEPVQHLISRFLKQMTLKLDAYYRELKDIEEIIQTLDLTNLTYETLEGLKNMIKEAEAPARENLLYIEKTLMIVWLSLRSDLVDELSFFKESWIKFLSLALGSAKTENNYASGLYLQLDLKLASLFKKNELGPALEDEDSVQEGLARLSLWQFKDFAEVGLIEEEKVNDEPMGPSSLRTSLLLKMHKNLETMGLRTIKDLKTHEIYSKPMLKAFIEKNKS